MHLYQCFENLILEPLQMKMDFSHSRIEWDLPNGIAPQLVKTQVPHIHQDLPMRRVFTPGSVMIQLRCVRLPDGATMTKSRWAAESTFWPSAIFVSLNDQALEIRRRTHHPRDLSIDVTDFVLMRHNVLQVSLHRNQHEKESKSTYALGIECIKIIDRSQALQLPTHLKIPQCLATIKARLAPSSTDAAADNDDEIEVVNPHISIDLIDPFSSKIFTTPVRGKDCVHQDCFDLDNFLNSRPLRTPNGLVGADAWLCPICKKDARPGSLIIDDFLAGVRHKLQVDGKLEYTRAILVKADGSWRSKTPDTAGSAPSTARVASAVHVEDFKTDTGETAEGGRSMLMRLLTLQANSARK